MFLICEMGRRSTLPSCAMGMVQPWITERWDQSSCSVGKCASGGGGEALSQWVRVQKGWGCERDWLYSESTQNFNKTKSWLWTVGVGLPEENFQQLLEPDYRLRTRRTGAQGRRRGEEEPPPLQELFPRTALHRSLKCDIGVSGQGMERKGKPCFNCDPIRGFLPKRI